MDQPAICIENLGKLYRIGRRHARHRTIREAITEYFGAPFRRSTALQVPIGPQADHIWALKNLTLEIKHGEVVGIIGRNGSGKSTLLKILSRITEPTEGYAEIHGRIGSLLEVGTGFHSELTGRENIFLNGAILGMKRTEIIRRFDEIVAFAEIDKFLDTPVKHYSSGMYVRLAFAVAAHLDPDILLVDEVLAVGDAGFQKKCLGKMDRAAKDGRTVLLVSHSTSFILSLCGRVICMEEGLKVDDGPAKKVIESYLRTDVLPAGEQLWADINTAPGNHSVRIRYACVSPENGSPSDPITVQTPFVIVFEYWNLVPGAQIDISLLVYNAEGTTVFNTGTVHEFGPPSPAGLFRGRCHIPGGLMNDGIHKIELLLVKDETIVIYRQKDILTFEVQDAPDMRGTWYGKWPGAVRPRLDWSLELLERNQ